MTLSDRLKGLPPEDYAKLIYAFNHGLSDQFVRTGDKDFIGVNITLPNFNIKEQAGEWARGTINE